MRDAMSQALVRSYENCKLNLQGTRLKLNERTNEPTNNQNSHHYYHHAASKVASSTTTYTDCKLVLFICLRNSRGGVTLFLTLVDASITDCSNLSDRQDGEVGGRRKRHVKDDQWRWKMMKGGNVGEGNGSVLTWQVCSWHDHGQ